MKFPRWTRVHDDPRPPPAFDARDADDSRWFADPGGAAAAGGAVDDDDPFEDPDSPLLADDDLQRLWHDDDDPADAAVSGDGAVPPCGCVGAGLGGPRPPVSATRH